jgi:hypothetical protein
LEEASAAFLEYPHKFPHKQSSIVNLILFRRDEDWI